MQHLSHRKTMIFSWDQRTWENQYFNYDLIPVKKHSTSKTKELSFSYMKVVGKQEQKLCIIGLLKPRWMEREQILSPVEFEERKIIIF